MAAPIYTDAEVKRLVAMPKRVSITAVDTDARIVRPTKGETKRTTPVRPEDVAETVEFQMEECWKDDTDEYSVMLHVKLPPKPWQTICRFDIQDVGHRNPPWHLPLYIPSGVPHYHTYTERAIEEEDEWSKAATPIDFGNARDLTSGQEQTRLRGAFLKHLNMRFLDSESASDLFPGGM